MREAGRVPRCRIIGSGEEHANLATQIRDAGLEATVRLEGPRPQAEVIAAMRQAAVLACPCVVGSDGNRDGLPTVLLEAMAVGLPVVSTDVVGIPELVRDGQTGLIAPEGDPEALAAALMRMTDEAGLRHRLSTAARALIEAECDVSRSAAALREVFAAAITRRRQSEAA
jgi:glycosyltransferase involved in cell wall biosynthesis